MTTLTMPYPKRTPVSVLLSVALHGSVIAAILYASFHQSVNVPKTSQPISVSLVAPEVQPEPAPVVEQPQPEPQPEPEPVPEPQPVPDPPKAEPVPIPVPPKPKPKPRPKPKVEHKREVKPRQEAKPQENLFKQDAPSTQTKPTTAPKSNPSPVQSASQGPKAVSVSKPGYPNRALALRIEGRVRVQFDVGDDGRVENITVLSAQPRNMFERAVKEAMRQWRYQPGRPGKNLTMNIVFRLNGGTSIE